MPGLGAFIRALRLLSRAARRVRPRRGAHDAADRAPTGTRSASSSRGRASGRACRARCSPARRWSRCRRACRSSPSRSTARQSWKPGNLKPVSIAWGEPMTLRRAAEGRQGLQGGVRAAPGGDPPPLGLAGRDARARAAGRRPACGGTPLDAMDGRRSQRRCRPRSGQKRRDGGDRRLPERRQVDARQPADAEPGGGRPRDARGDARPQGAALRLERRHVPPRRHGRRRRGRHGPVRPPRSPSRRAPRSGRPTSSCSSSTRGRGSPRATRSSRRSSARPAKPVIVLANKIDDPRRDLDAVEFHRLGLGDPVPLSALHGHGTGDLLDDIVDAAARAGTRR